MSSIIDRPITQEEYEKQAAEIWMVDFSVYAAFRAECLRLEKIKNRLLEDCRKLREYKELLK